MITPDIAREWRRGRRLTQQRVADILGVSRLTYGKYERGVSSSMAYDTMVRLEELVRKDEAKVTTASDLAKVKGVTTATEARFVETLRVFFTHHRTKRDLEFVDVADMAGVGIDTIANFELSYIESPYDTPKVNPGDIESICYLVEEWLEEEGEYGSVQDLREQRPAIFGGEPHRSPAVRLRDGHVRSYTDFSTNKHLPNADEIVTALSEAVQHNDEDIQKEILDLIGQVQELTRGIEIVEDEFLRIRKALEGRAEAGEKGKKSNVLRDPDVRRLAGKRGVLFELMGHRSLWDEAESEGWTKKQAMDAVRKLEPEKRRPLTSEEREEFQSD